MIVSLFVEAAAGVAFYFMAKHLRRNRAPTLANLSNFLGVICGLWLLCDAIIWMHQA